MTKWRVDSKVHTERNTTEFFVSDGSNIAYYVRYPNITYQNRRTRLWNWLRRKGSTKAVIVLDINAVGRNLAEHYGLEWNDV